MVCVILLRFRVQVRIYHQQNCSALSLSFFGIARIKKNTYYWFDHASAVENIYVKAKLKQMVDCMGIYVNSTILKVVVRRSMKEDNIVFV